MYVFFAYIYPNVLSTFENSRYSRCSTANETIEHNIIGFCEKLRYIKSSQTIKHFARYVFGYIFDLIRRSQKDFVSIKAKIKHCLK